MVMPVKPDPAQAAIDKRESQLDPLMQQITTRQSQLDEERLAEMKAFNTSQTAGEQDLRAAEAAPMPTPPTPTDIGPPPDLKHPVDAKNYQQMAFAMLAMAMIGGRTSRGNWLGAASALNGALKGYKDGNEAVAKEQMAEYDRKFQAARQHDADANKKFMDILEARNTSLNQKRELLQMEAAKHGREDARFAAMQGSIDRMLAQVNAGRNALMNTEQKHTDMMIHISLEREKMEATKGKGRNATFTPEQSAWAADYFSATQQKISAWGGGAEMVQSLIEQGITPQQVAAGGAQFAAYKSALRVNAVRQTGVDRLTKSIQTLEPVIIKTAKELGLTEVQLMNSTLNGLRRQFGNAKLSELQTEVAAWGRQYMEAVTMPGSTAQLHVSSAELGDVILNVNMPIGAMIGSMHGANMDIAAGKYALDQVSKAIVDHIKKLGYGDSLWRDMNDIPGQVAPGAPAAQTKVLKYNPATGKLE
jgi:hypothetical protein